MKASYGWLRALVPGLTASPSELAQRLTSAGLEVEAMLAYGEGAEACVVVSVVSMRPHPTKSGLRLVTVDRGGGTHLEIVCGAPNVPEPGGLVVLAPLGAHLPAKKMTIERRAIGGVTSEGMLCSESELGLTEDSEGILILPAGSAKAGDRFIDAVPAARDTVFEIGLTPNRADGLGHVGLAREAAALFGIPWHAPAPEAPARAVTGESVDKLARVTVEDAERCPHYGACAVVNVTIGPSPLWIRYRLSALGVRSISNVVDITNLVMLEYGHPMHAFDLDRVRGGTIVVRRAKEGEAMKTLDGVDRALSSDDLVICDAEGPVALAGVMGAANSEIQASTKRVLFECAYFEPRGVRRASRRHGLHTESSHRFERGVDPGDVEDVLAHAASLATTLAGASAVPGAIHAIGKRVEARTTTLRPGRIEKMLGVAVPMSEARAILERLGCVAKSEKSDGAVEFTLPTHRPDLSREIDLIEEVGRVRGFEAIPAVLPPIHATREGKTREGLLRRARAAAVAIGLDEAVTYSFTDEASLAKLGAPAPTVRVKNPINELHVVMRTSLVPSLLACIDRAARRGERDARLFTMGPLFFAKAGQALPEERASLAVVLAGERAAWLAKGGDVDAWDAKGIAEGIVRRMLGRVAVVRACTESDRPKRLHPRAAAFVSVEGKDVGVLGLLHPDVIDDLGLEIAGPVAIVELDLDALESIGARVPQLRPLPRFPASARDLAVVVKNEVRAGDVESAIRAVAGDLAEDVRLFDRFTGGAVPPDHASLAIRVVYRRPDRTLTDAEVDASHAKVVAEVSARFGATLRA